jgi:hypothetical protein
MPPNSNPRWRIPAGATENQCVACKLTTKTGQKVYARRKAIVETVFAQMSTLQNPKHLLLRGFERRACIPGGDTPTAATLSAQ